MTYIYRANHSNYDIDAEDNDFAGLDFAALDSLAGYKEQGSPAEERQGGMQGDQLEVLGSSGNGSSEGAARSSEGAARSSVGAACSSEGAARLEDATSLSN